MRWWSLMLALPLMACGVNAGSSDDDGAGVPATGSGNTRSFAVTDFSRIDVAGADDVDVRVGTGYSVRAEGEPEALDRLRIDREDDTLRIRRKKRDGIGWSSGPGVKIYVTLPRLTEANLAGSGNFAVDRVEGAAFKGAIAGSGNLHVGALAVESAAFDLAGSGSVRAEGTTRQLDIDIAGAGDVDAPGLTASAAEVSIAGSGGVKAHVKGSATVSIMGSGDVDLGPEAKCETSKMGSGSVRCG